MVWVGNHESKFKGMGKGKGKEVGIRITVRARVMVGLGLVAHRLRRVRVGVVGAVILGGLIAGELDIRTAVLAAAGERAELADLVRVVRFL